MLDAPLESLREWSPVLSTFGIVGLAITIVAFWRSERFRRGVLYD